MRNTRNLYLNLGHNLYFNIANKKKWHVKHSIESRFYANTNMGNYVSLFTGQPEIMLSALIFGAFGTIWSDLIKVSVR